MYRFEFHTGIKNAPEEESIQILKEKCF